MAAPRLYVRWFLAATVGVCLLALPRSRCTGGVGLADVERAEPRGGGAPALEQFEFTPAQLEVLQKLAKATASEIDRDQKGKGSEAFRKALNDLRDVLVQGGTPSTILEDRVDTLRDAEDTDVDEDVEITDAARRLAPGLLRQLSVHQVAAYFNNYREEIPEPLDTMLEALAQVQDLKENDWKELRDQTTEEVGWLLGGLDKKKAKLVADKVEDWLNTARKMKADDFSKHREELAQAARQFVGQVPPTVVLHNFAEHGLAELLSNPQLPTALEARFQQGTPPPK